MALRRVFLQNIITEPAFRTRVQADGGTVFVSDPAIDAAVSGVRANTLDVILPFGKKTGKVYSLFGLADLAVNRNSIATYVSSGSIITAIAHEPRFQSSKILVEAEDTNLVEYSRDISNAYWSKIVVSTTSPINSPLGTSTAYKIEDANNDAGQAHWINTSINPNAVVYFSCFIKKGERIWTQLLATTSGNLKVFFNSDTGAIGTVSGTYYDSAQIVDFANGWYRCIVKTKNITSSLLFGIKTSTGDDILTNTGEIGKGQYITGIEIKSTLSSYIPTNGTTVTRLADVMTCTHPLGTLSIIETIGGVEQSPITTIPATYQLPIGNIDKVEFLSV